MILIILFPILAEILHDFIQYSNRKEINHIPGIIIRLGAAYAFYQINPLLIPLLIAAYIMIFDHVMGLLIAQNPFYIGKTSTIDKAIRKSKILSDATYRTFIRIWLAGVLSSFYFFNEQWAELYQEVKTLVHVIIF